jgi:hypothetical protein
MMDEVVALLQEKLVFLEKAFVLETSAAQKFALAKQIEEIKQALVSRGSVGSGGNEPTTRFGHVSIQSVSGNVNIQQAGGDIVTNRK